MALRLSLPAPSVITVIILPFGQAMGAGRPSGQRSRSSAALTAASAAASRKARMISAIRQRSSVLLSGLRAWIVPAPAAWLAKI